ncbi:MAG: helix-turn-helix transcriptional regulator [Candidatus Omnitrophica bacterium]|nr:helix-turn-helix transcriptional regulator [Candidatus Omnitrophota bacterium]
MNFSKAIRVLMEENDLSSKQVEQETGWSHSYVSGVRCGSSDPMPRLREWADTLGVPIEALIARAKEYEPKNGAAA